MKYASIVPLIGGESIAVQNVLNQKPEYVLSYSPFSANDRHYLNWIGDQVPYHLLDEKPDFKAPHVDIVNSVCPCAGLSSLSTTSNANSSINDWMFTTAEYVLSVVQPKVFWGENAPRLGTQAGAPVSNKLRAIGKKYGYTFSIYRTKSILHGLSQIRDRTFYFFWKGNEIPVFEYYERPYMRIEDQILSSARNDDDEMFKTYAFSGKPSDNPWYKYVLEEVEGGISHADFFKKIDRTTGPMSYIEANNISYLDVGKWMSANGHDKLAAKCQKIEPKLKAGGNIMRKTVEVPKDYIGAFVGHLLMNLTHPTSDRFINVREALDIMKMPKDFQLLDAPRTLNMVAQNVPVSTAQDMVYNIVDYYEGKLNTHKVDNLIQDNKTKKLHFEYTNALDAFMN